MIAVTFNYTLLHTRGGEKITATARIEAEDMGDIKDIIEPTIDMFDTLGYNITSIDIRPVIEGGESNEG